MCPVAFVLSHRCLYLLIGLCQARQGRHERLLAFQGMNAPCEKKEHGYDTHEIDFFRAYGLEARKNRAFLGSSTAVVYARADFITPHPLFARPTPCTHTHWSCPFCPLQVTSSHVGMLVCGIFNASVASESMGEGFRFDLAAREWRRGGGRGGGGAGAEAETDEVIAVDCDAKFVVTR